MVNVRIFCPCKDFFKLFLCFGKAWKPGNSENYKTLRVYEQMEGFCVGGQIEQIGP